MREGILHGGSPIVMNVSVACCIATLPSTSWYALHCLYPEPRLSPPFCVSFLRALEFSLWYMLYIAGLADSCDIEGYWFLVI